MCLEQYFVFICHLSPKTCRLNIDNFLFFKNLFTSPHFTLVEKLSDQLNAALYYEMRKYSETSFENFKDLTLSRGPRVLIKILLLMNRNR